MLYWMRWMTLVMAAMLLLACGSDGEDEEAETPDQTTPEGTAELLFEEMKAGDFTCASPLYFGQENILAYFPESLLGQEGTIGVCQKLKQDAQNGMYTMLQDSAALFAGFDVEDEGTMVGTLPDMTLPYIEGTAVSADEGYRVHINRLVQHEGKWYVLVLLGLSPILLIRIDYAEYTRSHPF